MASLIGEGGDVVASGKSSALMMIKSGSNTNITTTNNNDHQHQHQHQHQQQQMRSSTSPKLVLQLLPPNNNNSSSSTPSITPPSNNSETAKKNTTAPPPSTCEFEESGASASLRLKALRFDADGDVEVESPDSSLWESFFSDQLLEAGGGDFMICSPVRTTIHSPQPSQSNYNYSYAAHHHHHHPTSITQGRTFSPPRSSSPLRPYYTSNSTCNTTTTTTTKGKGLSPLHKVFNNSNSHTSININDNNLQFMQPDSLSLPSLSTFLDDDDYDHTIISNNSIPNSNNNYHYHHHHHLVNLGGDYDPDHHLVSCYSSSDNNNNIASQRFDSFTTADDCLTFSKSCVEEDSSSLPEAGGFYHLMDSINLPIVEDHPPPPHINTLMLPLAAIGHDQQEQDSGLQLVHLLLACAETVAKEDYMLARRYLHHLNRVVTPLGDSMQRVASCFTEALSARLAATMTTTTTKSKPSKTPAFTPFPPNSLEILKIYQIVYQACPYIKFAHFTANQAIFEAFESEERVHVIDLDILQGYQWPAFMQALAARPGGPPFLRITGVGTTTVRETGRCLTELAQSLHIPFEFHPVDSQLEDLKSHMLQRRVGEALAVNSVSRLHRVPAQSLGNLLAMIRDQAPKIVTIVEQEAGHNGPYFLGRFLEALHYYSAIFDSLDATFPADSAQRAKVEQYIFAPEIRNVVATEGADRVLRHERLDKWRKIMEGKGFEGIALSPNAVTQSNILLSLYSCAGYRLTEDNGCLLLGWQDRPILAASAWRC